MGLTFFDLKRKIEGGGRAATRYFMVNGINCPAPGTDFTPEQKGAILAASKTAKKCWIPLNCLKIGDEILSYKLTGPVTSGGNAVTVDAKIAKIAKAGTVTNITGGAITQVSKTAGYTMDEECTLTDRETVATDYMYGIEIVSTTGAACTAIITGVELRFNRKG